MGEVVSTDTISNFDDHLVQVDIDAAGNVKMYVDGIELTISGVSTITKRLLDGDGVFGGELTSTASDFIRSVFEGNVGEVLVYGRKIDDTERVNLTAFLKTKWGIS
jgi:hypothetical protein